MTVVATHSSLGLAARVAELLSDELVLVEEKLFPDGERYLRVPCKLEGDVILVHSTHPPQDERIMELLLAIDAVRGAGAKRVVVVTPYLAYARQDKRFLEGEPISIGVVLQAVQAVGADALVVVDIHKPSSLDEWLRIPHINVLPIKQLAEYFKGRLRDPLILAPDKGALHRARDMARVLDADYDYLEKRRDRVTGEIRVLPKSMSVEGRDVLIVDDIISTGRTLAAAARSAISAGARGVYAACTHALLVSGALDKVYGAGVREVVATDTVPSPISKVSVAEPIAEALKRLSP